MTQHLIEDLLIILAAGLAAGLVCRVINASVLIGYLIVGAILGQGLLGWVQDETHQLEHFAEVGVFLLLFSIGLEFSLDDLKRLGRHLLVGGSIQMLLVAIPVSLLLRSFDLTWPSAILIAAATAFSSTVLVFKALSEQGQVQTRHGRRAIGVLLFQDAALVPLLLLVPLLTGDADTVGAWSYVRLAVVSVLFVMAIVALRIWLARTVIPMLAKYRSPELVVLFTVVALAAVTWAAYRVGLPPAVGAFAAGLIFNGNRWTKQIDSLVLPFRETFSAIFFIGLGLVFEPWLYVREPLLMVGALGGVIALKMLAAGVALFATGLSVRRALGAGLGLAHVGEFAFVLTLLGLEAGVVSEAAYVRVVAVAVGSLILTPMLMRLGLRLARLTPEQDDEVVARLPATEQEKRALVIGAGPVGKQVASQLEMTGYDVCLVDQSPINLHAFAQSGFRTVAGDATDPHVLRFANLDETQLAVVSVTSDEAAVRIVRSLRQQSKTCVILVRHRYLSNAEKLRSVGANHVVSEEVVASSALLKLLGSLDPS